jgi:hypothetical protein
VVIALREDHDVGRRNRLDRRLGATADTGPVVCATCAATQPIDYNATVPAGQIATGIFGGDGLWDDRVGFDSSRATIAPR